MKELILFIFLLGLFSCSLSKDKMLGDDIRLWQDTDAWQLAKAVKKGDTTLIDKILKGKKYRLTTENHALDKACFRGLFGKIKPIWFVFFYQGELTRTCMTIMTVSLL